MSTTCARPSNLAKKNRTANNIKKYWLIYVMLIVPAVQVFIFNYMPMYGILMSFKDFKVKLGIMGSPWVGFKYFNMAFSDPLFFRALKNTLNIGLLTIFTVFPMTIVLAIMLNEVTRSKLRRVIQTITYFPHFLSWVVVGSFVYMVLSPSTGIVNIILQSLGLIDEPVFFMAQAKSFVPIYLISSFWKSAGYNAVIYLAAMASIDPGLYEAATIDGAGRFQRIWHITLPGIAMTIVTLLILEIGRIIGVSFEPIYVLYRPVTYESADILATYVYRKGLVDLKYSYSAAIGLFQNVVGFILVILSNRIARVVNPDYRIL